MDMKKWVSRGIQSAFVIGILAAVCGSMREREQQSASKTLFAMDTYMEITTYGEKSKQAVEAATKEIERLDALLSTGSEDSEISLLNQGKQGRLSEDTRYLYQRSMELYGSTKGKFDITIYPVMRLWGFTDSLWHVPEQAELEKALRDVDASALIFDEDTGLLLLPQSTEVDFGGIAKGYTTQKLVELMKEYGIEHANLNLGGNVRVIGKKSDGSLWKIGIKDPKDTNSFLGVVQVEDKAVITSGGYERYFEQEGIRYHHIIDPDTGFPAKSGLASVTIISEHDTLADGLSTALFVMGLEEATDYWREHTDINDMNFDAVFATEDGELYVTQGIAEYFQSSYEFEILKR